MSKKNKTAGLLPIQPSWTSLLLVCKDCRRRKNGPRHLKPKALASDVKSLMKATVPHGRVVLTTCLKLCPKNAVAVAFAGETSAPRIVAIASSKELHEALPRLIG